MATLARTRSEELDARRMAAVARGVGITHPVFADAAEGVRLRDVDGREFLDFAGGIGVLNLGHRHPGVVEAVRAQLDRFTHTCFQVAMYESYVAVAERLAAAMPGDFAKKTLLVSTGAEANENAVKIARAATGRPAVIAFAWGYHGRTLLTLSMTGKVTPYQQNFGPFAPEIFHAPYPYAYRGWDSARALAALHELFETQVAPGRVAAIVIEPVLGEGGFVPAPPEFLRELRAIATKHQIVLVADEVQTGFGRTGTMFAIEQAGVVPDLLVTAKSLAGGLPLAAVVGRASVMDAVDPGGLGGTYAGNPLACAAALATFDAFEDGRILARANEIGRRTRRALDALAARHPEIGDVRGLGAMQAMEFVDVPAGAVSYAKRVVDAARERGLLLLSCGYRGNVVRLLTPLVVSDADLDDGLSRLAGAVADVLASGERFSPS